MAKYDDQNARKQPDIKTGDQVMLNGKNMRSKRPSKKLSPKLYCPFKVLQKRGVRAYKLLIPDRWKIHLVFHVSLLEPYRISIRPALAQPPRAPEVVDGCLEFKVERVVSSEIISYTRQVQRH